MCFSTPFSAVHEFISNQTSASESVSEPVSEESSQEQQPIVATNVKDEPDSMDVSFSFKKLKVLLCPFYSSPTFFSLFFFTKDS